MIFDIFEHQPVVLNMTQRIAAEARAISQGRVLCKSVMANATANLIRKRVSVQKRALALATLRKVLDVEPQMVEHVQAIAETMRPVVPEIFYRELIRHIDGVQKQFILSSELTIGDMLKCK